jgi:hypothetical protein
MNDQLLNLVGIVRKEASAEETELLFQLSEEAMELINKLAIVQTISPSSRIRDLGGMAIGRFERRIRKLVAITGLTPLLQAYRDCPDDPDAKLAVRAVFGFSILGEMVLEGVCGES